LVATARQVHAQDVNVICFQGGEIPQTTATVAATIPAVRDMYGGRVEILLNLGNKTHAEYARLKESGATSYIIKHETSDPDLNARMRHESLDSRLVHIRDLIELGYRVGTDTIVGLPGQSLRSIAHDIVLARELGVHLARIGARYDGWTGGYVVPSEATFRRVLSAVDGDGLDDAVSG
jgi:biotin synthase